VSRDFRHSVFSSNNPLRALIHGLKPFRIWLRIRRENRVGNRQNRLPRPRKPKFLRRSFVQKTTFLCINNVVEIFVRIRRSLSDRGSHTFQTIISIFSANSKPYSKQLLLMNQGPRGDCLMKKPRVENLLTLSLWRRQCYRAKSTEKHACHGNHGHSVLCRPSMKISMWFCCLGTSSALCLASSLYIFLLQTIPCLLAPTLVNMRKCELRTTYKEEEINAVSISMYLCGHGPFRVVHPPIKLNSKKTFLT
jgi:hypothetical protein